MFVVADRELRMARLRSGACRCRSTHEPTVESLPPRWLTLSSGAADSDVWCWQRRLTLTAGVCTAGRTRTGSAGEERGQAARCLGFYAEGICAFGGRAEGLGRGSAAGERMMAAHGRRIEIDGAGQLQPCAQSRPPIQIQRPLPFRSKKSPLFRNVRPAAVSPDPGQPPTLG